MFQKCILAAFFLGSSALFAQTPVIQSVLNAADYSPMVAPGVWVAIFGSNLAPSTVTDTTLPLPPQLGGVSVMLTSFNTNENAPLRYVSANQINALIPFDLQPGGYNLTVSTPSGSSAQFGLNLSVVAPAIYTQNAAGTGPALAFDANFRAVTQVSNSPIVLYASGLGPTNPQTNTASGGNSAEPLNRTVYTPQVFIGGATAQVAFSGVAPGLPGVYQLNVTPSATTPPADDTLAVRFFLPSTDYPVQIYGAVTTIPVTTGLNTANVTGGIAATYPLNSTLLGYSPLLTAAKFNVDFDILPSSQPFNVVASCPGGSMTIALNPAAGTWQATANFPTSAMRSGDFSALANPNGTPERIFDFVNNNNQFPGNIIPQSRIDPVAGQVMAAMPAPNSSAGVGNFVVQGAIPADGHFVVSDTVNANLENFGGFVYVNPFGASQLYARTNACSVTVDGTLVGSTMVNFQ